MPALSAYIRGFPRKPEDARDYIASTNAIFATAFGELGIDETKLVHFEFVPYNPFIWVVMVYKA